MSSGNPSKPLVSIITPAYNSGSFIRACVESVKEQSLQDWEHILIDDASTDATAEIIHEITASDPRVRYFRNPTNIGVVASRNRAFGEARGRYLAFLDSDDCWLREKLERQISFMKSTGAAFSFTSYRRMSEDGTRVGEIIRAVPTVTYSDLLKRTLIGGGTVVVDLEQTGPIRMDSDKHEDYVLWLSLLRRGFIAHGIDEDLARYRLVKGSVNSNKLKSFFWVWNVYRNIEHLSVPRSAWCFFNYLSYAAQKGRTL